MYIYRYKWRGHGHQLARRDHLWKGRKEEDG